jgi:hypothetical protein
MYTDCALPECSGAAGVAANAVTFRKRAIAVNSKTLLKAVTPYCMARPAAAMPVVQVLVIFVKHYHPGEAIGVSFL